MQPSCSISIRRWPIPKILGADAILQHLRHRTVFNFQIILTISCKTPFNMSVNTTLPDQSLIAACAAAKRAIGTRKGEQDT